MFNNKNTEYPPIDISYKMVKTPQGMKRVVTTKAEREQMRALLKRKNPKIPIIESQPIPQEKDNLSWIDRLEELSAIDDD